MNEEEIKKTVLLRLESMPDNIKISVGSFGEQSKKDLIKHVKKGDKFGKLIIAMQLKYLQSMKTGF